jgi:hypothetical protein
MLIKPTRRTAALFAYVPLTAKAKEVAKGKVAKKMSKLAQSGELVASDPTIRKKALSLLGKVKEASRVL